MSTPSIPSSTTTPTPPTSSRPQQESLLQQFGSIAIRVAVMVLIYSVVFSSNSPISSKLTQFIRSNLPPLPNSPTSSSPTTIIPSNKTASPSDDLNVLAQELLERFSGTAAVKHSVLPPDPYLISASVPLRNRWKSSQNYELRVYISEHDNLTFSEAIESNFDVFWMETNLSYSFDPSNKNRSISVNYTLPKYVINNNQSLFLHAFAYTPAVIKNGKVVFPTDILHDSVLHTHHELTEWKYRDLRKQGKSLLNKEDSVENEPTTECATSDETESGSCGYDGSKNKDYAIDQLWKPELDLVFVVDYNVFKPEQFQGLPPIVQSVYKSSSDHVHYLPPFYASDFWLLSENRVVINESTTTVPLTLTLSNIGIMKFMMYSQMDAIWSSQQGMGGADEIKRMMLETNPYLLGLTAVVSLAHSVLEFLAFSSDIKHWRNTKSLEGISVRSMIWTVVMQLVIFLYLLDNETSFMVLVGQFFGLVLEVWKLGKAIKVKSFGKIMLFGIIPWFEFEEAESYSNNKTKEYDDTAMKYLSYVMYPLVAGYAVYSLVYNKHKSWYSWLLSSGVGAVYAFGFIMMFPQIFINYKLKSVAHLPMKAFLYKSLNTVIDDLFSFIIKMPLMHRLACFRDDIVFVIFLYQRWIYPVDKSRVNEYGQVVEEERENPLTVAGTTTAETQPKKKKKIVKKVVVVKKKSSNAALHSNVSENVSESTSIPQHSSQTEAAPVVSSTSTSAVSHKKNQ